MSERPEPTATFVLSSVAHPSQHGHQVDLEVGLEFVNTLEFTRSGVREHLPTADVALHWLRGHELMHEESQIELLQRVALDEEGSERLLGKVQRVREAMRELVDASVTRRPPEPKALDRVNRMLRTPYTYYLVPAPDGVSLDHRHEGDPVDGALARLVESIAREISQGHPERLRICADDECQWAFNDTSPTGRRKWCDMNTCGNRAKAARFRERQKASGAVA